MNQYLYETNKQLLQDLMQQINIADIDELAQTAKVSRLQVIRIQKGLILNVSTGAIIKIARTLKMSVDSLIETFLEKSLPQVEPQKVEEQDALATCRQEYQNLQQEMLQQQSFLETEFQKASLETIESWLLQWPTAVAAVKQNPQLPAERLLSLVEPVEQLLEQWDVITLASVGEELPYDPQHHQLMKGMAQQGELVKVRYVGYKQNDRLLYKAKVSPVFPEEAG